MFSAERLRMARFRRKLSGKGLAEAAGLTPVTVSKAENGHQPDEATVQKLADALEYPIDFFFMEPPETLETKAVSFRSLKKMSAAERNASLAAGSIGIAFYDWIEKHFNLPLPDLIDLSKERDRPEVAARLLRQHWGLGDRPIGSLLKLYESKGIRVLSLSENTPNVDAYSFWHAERPYMFLNQRKTAERSNFDSAHELGHLVLHFHAARQSAQIDDAEKQADQFASAFLMPEDDVKSRFGHVYSASQIIQAKHRWKVSAMALATRLHGLGMLSDWNYRSIIIELGQRGYRKGEPVGVERETSTVLGKVLAALWKNGVTRSEIAQKLNLPWEEVETLIFDLAGHMPSRPEAPSLRLVR
ncbi:helix-turn-helix domain-containing protein [Leisingera methylohalidivorans]|uniref:XRE family transcriptional regulator n=1 Tax=Leisingera methylohalidivorans DSM 14336 TaxID=999552 RepID=V9VU79_9RHOB|nr:ImmA/IrrE family metallo-endopeptidase [Leisingera methylohalidivorans]AHD02286.1 XRE family transcriptional regulator [Leisingera methylohalidivorans DSM 14336]